LRAGAEPRDPGALWTRHLWQRDEPLRKRMLLAPLVPLEALYAGSAWLHRTLHRRGLRATARLPVHVVSVGNLTVGGSAKTPTAAWLAGELRDRGRKVALLSRGVGGRSSEAVNVVSDGERVLLGASDVGDEPVWLAQRLPGVPVLAGRNRLALGLRAASAFASEILILDDGFQHHRVARDIDLLCVDAGLGFGNGHVLPRGPLREPAHVARLADAVIWTRLVSAGGVHPRLPELDGIPEFALDIRPKRLRSLRSGRASPLESLRGQRVGVITAIARPDRLCADLRALGADVREVRAFADHHPYRRRDLAGLASELRWITTGKDAVKIPAEWLSGDVDVLEEEVEPRGRSVADWVIARLSASPLAH
jgi:tetraacyldisaccharide 4'-kinase